MMYSARTRVAPMTFFEGTQIFFRGMGFIVSRPSVWLYAAVPMVAAFGLTMLLSVYGIWKAHGEILHVFGAVHQVFGEIDADIEQFGYWLAQIVVYIVVVVGAVLLGGSLAQPLSGPALDAIAREQEMAMGWTETPSVPFFESVVRSIKITAITLAMGIPIFIVLSLIEIVLPVSVMVMLPLKLAVSSVLAAWNLLDYPFGRQRMDFGARYKFFRSHLWACAGFGLPVAIIAFIPLIGLLILPAGVAGATYLFLTCMARENRG